MKFIKKQNQKPLTNLLMKSMISKKLMQNPSSQIKGSVKIVYFTNYTALIMNIEIHYKISGDNQCFL